MRKILGIVYLGVGAMGLAGAPAADWPNWRGAHYDGISRETGWDAGEIGNVAWKAEVGVGFSSVAVVGGKVYTLGHSGDRRGGKETVSCLDAATGDVVWSDSYDAELLPRLHEGGPAATPAVDGDAVFTLGKDGKLRCYGAADGSVRWKADLLEVSEMDKPAEWGFAGSPLVVGDLLVVEAARTVAFDKKTGKAVWRSERYLPAYGTPTAFERDGKTLLVTLKTDGLVVLEAETGKTVAFREWKTRFQTNANTPMVRGDEVFVSTGYQRGCGLFRFDGKSLEEVYTSNVMSNHMNNCVLLDGKLYGFDGNTHTGGTRDLVCMDWASGEEHWRESGMGCGSLTAAGDRLVVLSEKGELVVAAASADGFEEQARAQVTAGRCWTVPVLSGGRIFVRNAAGRVVCVEVGTADGR